MSDFVGKARFRIVGSVLHPVEGPAKPAEPTTADVETRLPIWLADAQANIDAHFARSFPKLNPDRLSVDPGGKRWIRIVTTRIESSGNEGQRCVYCFVERATGLVFMSASWKAPAKHSRGSIFEAASKSVTTHGAKYLR